MFQFLSMCFRTSANISGFNYDIRLNSGIAPYCSIRKPSPCHISKTL